MNDKRYAFGISIFYLFVCTNSQNVMSVILAEFRASIPGVSYIPTGSGFFVQRDAKQGKDDTTIRAVLGVENSQLTMSTAGVCGAANENMVTAITKFFVDQTGSMVVASPFQTIACRLDDHPPPGPTNHAKTVILIGFAPVRVLSVPGTSTTAIPKPDGIFTVISDQGIISQLVKILDTSFGPMNTGIPPSEPEDSNEQDNSDEKRELRPIRPNVGCSTKALLEETWTGDLTKPSNLRAKNLSRLFCQDLKYALSTAMHRTDLILACSTYQFLPYDYTDPTNGMKKQYTRISANFTVDNVDLSQTSGNELTELANRGLQQIATNVQSKILRGLQIMSLAEFFTCSRDGYRCSKLAACVQLRDGIACVCGPMYRDVDRKMPGTVCQSSEALIIVLSVLGSGCAIALLMAFVFASRVRSSHNMTI